jgi:hypothetical protein
MQLLESYLDRRPKNESGSALVQTTQGVKAFGAKNAASGFSSPQNQLMPEPNGEIAAFNILFRLAFLPTLNITR